jgi:hypothetical protein
VQALNQLVQAEHVHLLACLLLLQKFNSWIDACIEASPVPGICLFPEGHRSRLPHSLPLKRGMLNYAYSRKMPVQVCCSRNIRKPGAASGRSIAGLGEYTWCCAHAQQARADQHRLLII